MELSGWSTINLRIASRRDSDTGSFGMASWPHKRLVCSSLMSGRRGIQMGIALNNLANESKETDKKMSEIRMLMQRNIASGIEANSRFKRIFIWIEIVRVINMTCNTAHFSHAFFMKFFSEFQWTNISSDDIIVDVVQPECSAKHRTALTINLLWASSQTQDQHHFSGN